MAQIPNELTGPRVYVAVDDKKSAKMHLTGGFHKPERDKSMCGTSIEGKTLVDARDIAPHSEYQDSDLWCLRCIGILDLEPLDQKILFSAIKFQPGTYADLVVVRHLQRPSKLKTHPFRLTNAPPRKDWRIVK